MDQFMNRAAKPRSNTSVTKAEPSLKNSPATAGKIAKARGDECQLLSSSCFCFLSFLVDDGFKRSSVKEPVTSSKLEKERMEERRRVRSGGVERRLPLLDWRGGRRCLNGLDEDALYDVPEPVDVVAGGGREGRSDLASAMMGVRSTHGWWWGEVWWWSRRCCCREFYMADMADRTANRGSSVTTGPNGSVGRWLLVALLFTATARMDADQNAAHPAIKQGRSPVLAVQSCHVMSCYIPSSFCFDYPILVYLRSLSCRHLCHMIRRRVHTAGRHREPVWKKTMLLKSYHRNHVPAATRTKPHLSTTTTTTPMQHLP